jgi:hypothetical protein
VAEVTVSPKARDDVRETMTIHGFIPVLGAIPRSKYACATTYESRWDAYRKKFTILIRTG